MIRGFFLNLEKRKDRKTRMIAKLSSLSVSIERVEAIDGQSLSFNDMPLNFRGDEGEQARINQYATLQSHLKMIKLAKERKYKEVLILEDDVQFCSDFNERLEFALKEVPEDWDILYLGYTPSGFPNPKIKEHIIRNKSDYGCWAMIIKESLYDKIINLYETINQPCDEIIKHYILLWHNCYSFIPFLCTVETDYSDIIMKTRSWGRISQQYKDKL